MRWAQAIQAGDARNCSPEALDSPLVGSDECAQLRHITRPSKWLCHEGVPADFSFAESAAKDLHEARMWAPFALGNR
jgi:hypothetical protein